MPVQCSVTSVQTKHMMGQHRVQRLLAPAPVWPRTRDWASKADDHPALPRGWLDKYALDKSPTTIYRHISSQTKFDEKENHNDKIIERNSRKKDAVIATGNRLETEAPCAQERSIPTNIDLGHPVFNAALLTTIRAKREESPEEPELQLGTGTWPVEEPQVEEESSCKAEAGQVVHQWLKRAQVNQ